jgi:tetratricopeptide (TPR) repeat protein
MVKLLAEASEPHPAEEGTIAFVVNRLGRWVERADHGLTRVEYDFEPARNRAEKALESRATQAGIPFHSVNLAPTKENDEADQVILKWIDRTKEFKPGVVSVQGFAVLAIHDPRVVYALNYFRDALARPGLRQVWWMPRSFADKLIQQAPDLNSWFAMKLELSEVVFPVDRGHISFTPETASVNIDQARREAAFLVERAQKALAEGALFYDVVESFEQAEKILRNTGDRQEANHIKTKRTEASQQFSSSQRGKILVQLLGLLPFELSFLTLYLNVPSEYLPGKSAPFTKQIISLVEWAESPSGCGLNFLSEALERLLRPSISLSTSQNINTKGRLVNVPGGTDFFAGREEVLASLRAQLTPGNGRAAVLCGLGGIGKTQTAIEYARRHQSDYSIVLWCLADSEPSLTSGFAAFAPDLGLPEKTDVPELVRDVKRWLERNENWLLILDNADDPALAKTFIPAHHEGGVLLTSVASDFSAFGVANPDELDILTETEAMNFFRARFGRDYTEKENAELMNLVMELGHFPLALEQAAAYLRATKTPVAKYLADLKSRGLPVLEKGKATATPDYKKTVATTWQAAFEIIERDHPVSAEVLRLSAFLAPDKIPLELFNTLAPERDTANDLVAPLTHFFLVKLDGENQTFNVQRLVQEVTKSRLSKDVKHELIERVIRLVCDRFPNPEFGNWDTCRRLLPHGRVCVEFIQKYELEDESSALLLVRTGLFLSGQAQYAEAELLYKQALGIYERTLGPEHPDTITSLDNLADLYRLQGRYAEAETLFERVWGIREHSLGPEHPDTATSLRNLAALYRLQGRNAEAEPLFERALQIAEHTLGAEHLDTASSLSNLAVLYRSQGRYTEAEPLFERALRICEHALGKEHPNIALSLNNLALLYRSQGRYTEAEPLFERALEITERTLGAEHPDTAWSLSNLGVLYRSQGRYTEAEPLFERALRIREQVLGPEHPNTALSINNLALLYKLRERYAEAKPLFERALKILQKSLGGEHPNTKMVAKNLEALHREIQDEKA